MADFSMLLANNNRSKAYLQNLVAAGIMPAAVLLLRDGPGRLPEQTLNDKGPAMVNAGKFIRTHLPTGISFDEKETLEATLEKQGIRHEFVDSLDVNGAEVASRVKGLPGEYVVYSGPGGAILKPPILSQGKRLIHVHPGRLPGYRGSTTIYYSCLIEGKISASVIFMEAELDKGPVLLTMDFEVGSGTADFDYLVDPAVRTAALLEFMGDFENRIASAKPQAGAGDTFYIIHPVLKHMALLKAGKGGAPG